MIAVFYISGHGLGHASRDVEVINEIARCQPGARIIVRTGVAKWFFDASLRAAVDLQPFEADTGMAQIDSLRIDEAGTARRAARFYADFDAHTASEAAMLRHLNASVVVGDIPPLAFAAAARAGVPSLALGNFTWDWIYAGYPQFEDLAPGTIDVIRASYAHASGALRLPLHGGFESMRDCIEDIPLIARRSTLGRNAARLALGLDDGDTVVLASFGGYGLGLRYADIARSNPFTLIVTDHESGASPRDGAVGNVKTGTDRGRLLRLTSRDLAQRGLRYEDLVAGADVVVSKPGYGIVSECIANGAALLYTSRGPFREEDVFLEEMPKVLRCRHISREDLHAGRWSDAVKKLLGQPDPPDRLATHGSEVAASAIIERAEGCSSGLRRRATD